MKVQMRNTDGWERFLSLCEKLKTAKQFNDFFDHILTIEEKRAISDRVLIVRALLQDELTQREISQELGVSISKITRGSNSLKTIDDELKTFLIEALKQEDFDHV